MYLRYFAIAFGIVLLGACINSKPKKHQPINPPYYYAEFKYHSGADSSLGIDSIVQETKLWVKKGKGQPGQRKETVVAEMYNAFYYMRDSVSDYTVLTYSDTQSSYYYIQGDSTIKYRPIAEGDFTRIGGLSKFFTYPLHYTIIEGDTNLADGVQDSLIYHDDYYTYEWRYKDGEFSHTYTYQLNDEGLPMAIYDVQNIGGTIDSSTIVVKEVSLDSNLVIEKLANPLPSNPLELYQPKKRTYKKIQKGDRLPILSGEKLNGQTFDLTTASDSIYLLDFWFLNCLPCHWAFEEIHPLLKNYQNQKLAYYTINGLDAQNPKAISKFYKKTAMDSTKALLVSRKNIEDAGIYTYPNILIVKNGLVIEQMVGWEKGDSTLLRKYLDKAFE